MFRDATGRFRKPTIDEMLAKPHAVKPVSVREGVDHASIPIDVSALKVESPDQVDDAIVERLRGMGLDPEKWTIEKLWGNPDSPQVSVAPKSHSGGSLSDDEVSWVSMVQPVRKQPQRAPGGPKRSYLVALGDSQVGKSLDGDGFDGTMERMLNLLQKAYDNYLWYSSRYAVTDVVIAFLGDHIEGFVSQGGANAWRTPMALTDQIRVVRRTMLYAMEMFSRLGVPVRMVAVPGNHDQAVRFSGKGITRYDDSHDVESLIAVADAASLNPAVFGHVTFHVPQTDELSVSLDMNGTNTVFVHGHMMKPGKSHDWVKGQAYNRGSIYRDCDAVFHGHYHHFTAEESTDRIIVQVPALEGGSQWWKHLTGEESMQGILTCLVGEGRVDMIEIVR